LSTPIAYGGGKRLAADDPIRSFAAKRQAFGLCCEAVNRLQAPQFIRGASAPGDCKVFRQPPDEVLHRGTPAGPGHLLTYAGAGRAAGTDWLQPLSCCPQRSFNLSLHVNHMTTISQRFSGINS